MPITVNYSPVGAIGQAAQFAGQQQGQALAFRDALNLQGLGQRERFQGQDIALRNRAINAQVFQQGRALRQADVQQQRSIMANRANLMEQLESREYLASKQVAANERMALFQRGSQIERMQMEYGMRNELAMNEYEARKKIVQQQALADRQQVIFKEGAAQRMAQERLRIGMQSAQEMQAAGRLTQEQYDEVEGRLFSQFLGFKELPHTMEPEQMAPNNRPYGVAFSELGWDLMPIQKANGDTDYLRLGPTPIQPPKGLNWGDEVKFGLGGSGHWERSGDGPKFVTTQDPISTKDLSSLLSDVVKYFDERAELFADPTDKGAAYTGPSAAEVRAEFQRRLQMIMAARGDSLGAGVGDTAWDTITQPPRLQLPVRPDISPEPLFPPAGPSMATPSGNGFAGYDTLRSYRTAKEHNAALIKEKLKAAAQQNME